MKVYRLGVEADPTDEAANHDEWFSSLEKARQRRAGLIELYGVHLTDPSLEIEEVELASLSPKLLALAILNGLGYVRSREVVVRAYVPPPRED